MRRKGKFVNTGNEGDLGKDKRYDRSSQGYGFKGFHENSGRTGLRLRIATISGLVSRWRWKIFKKDNVVNQGRASNYESLKRQRLCKKVLSSIN